jgi:hypothetical protein
MLNHIYHLLNHVYHLLNYIYHLLNYIYHLLNRTYRVQISFITYKNASNKVLKPISCTKLLPTHINPIQQI